MDKKTKDRVLDYVLTKPARDDGYVSKISKHLSDLSKEEISSTLIELSKEGYVALSRSGDRIPFAMPLYKAYGYKREIKEQNTKLWADRRWNLFASLISGAVGGIIVQIVARLIFGNW